MILQGDTVRLKCHFKTFNGNAVDPTDIKLFIYDEMEILTEEIALNDTHRESVGVFYVDYLPAIGLNEFIFEFSGSYNNKPILSRGKVKIQFTK
ncbi:hypothetical protein [Fictibacillus phosphorivorans]|uniref:hypothetical protein n=1 Tax=Fictibacillus phosphorivorans TaxID=1221500 RepID=UPI00203C3A9A|nr:hypothetical protein [Fictibacillus phosphorivorans]MCM3719168.1 hypothetical protein [Fictibacillus phosphorivorans]MCM3776790.1 hypothetical protein [Fictibacillus phosphorivorans]